LPVWILASGIARAQLPVPETESPKFETTLGFGIASGPKFEGSNEYTLFPVPLIDFKYGRFFVSPLKGVGVNIPAKWDITIAPALNLRSERDLKTNGEVDDRAKELRFAAGASMTWRMGQFALGAGIFTGLTDANKGTSYDLLALYTNPISEKLVCTLGVSAAYADKDYNQTYFGITPRQSASSQYGVYDAGAGFKSVGTNASLNYVLNKGTSIGTFMAYTRLVGPAADSPIVKQGSPDQFSFGSIMLWHF
jgi:outer membrane scaffolding protein for murein synthesis (MipA/OmpV family)